MENDKIAIFGWFGIESTRENLLRCVRWIPAMSFLLFYQSAFAQEPYDVPCQGSGCAGFYRVRVYLGKDNGWNKHLVRVWAEVENQTDRDIQSAKFFVIGQETHVLAKVPRSIKLNVGRVPKHEKALAPPVILPDISKPVLDETSFLVSFGTTASVSPVTSPPRLPAPPIANHEPSNEGPKIQAPANGDQGTEFLWSCGTLRGPVRLETWDTTTLPSLHVAPYLGNGPRYYFRPPADQRDAPVATAVEGALDNSPRWTFLVEIPGAASDYTVDTSLISCDNRYRGIGSFQPRLLNSEGTEVMIEWHWEPDTDRRYSRYKLAGTFGK